MANRDKMRDFYCFIHDAANRFYSASYDAVGNIVVSTTQYPNMTPIEMSPANLRAMQCSFGTNKSYFSGVRALLINFEMIGDGADILRYVKYNGKGYAEELYLLIMRYNPNDGIYYKYYEGRFDFAQCKDTNTTFNIPCIDSSVWGILSQNEGVSYSIDCTSQANNAVPVLFDGINLKSRYTWQVVSSPYTVHVAPIMVSFMVDMVLVNSDGDSVGIITKSQNSGAPTEDNYIYKPTKANIVHLFGNYNFQVKGQNQYAVNWTLIGVTPTKRIILSPLAWTMTNSYTYHYMNFDVTFNLDAGEPLSLMFEFGRVGNTDWNVIPDVTNIYIETLTRSDAAIIWCRRPIDVLQEIVAKATNNKFTANSDFLTANNNIVLTCGNALRSAPNAVIKTSFQNFFKSYDIEYYLAFRIIGTQMWIEPIPVIYDDTTNLFDVGEIKEIELEDAYEYLCNEIELNMNSQDYRHTSGRLEFNGLNTFSVYQYNVKNKISLISPYRKDCYGMEFIRYDYQQQSTQDNTGDDATFMVDITDQTGAAGNDIFNYINIEVNNQPLSPIIYYPLNNDIIGNNKPVVSGVCQPNTVVNVYVDGIFDGTTTSDTEGNWSYDIQTALDYFEQDVNDGVHLIEATFTDLTGTQSSRTVTIVDTVVTAGFDNIHNNDSLYDNEPLIRGFLETRTTEQLFLDGASVASVTGDGNCRWQYKSPVLSNGRHVLTIGNSTIIINVFSFVELPLITSFQDGFQIIDNTPLVEGVAKPGTKVDLYLDYYPDVSIGTTFADANGNWSIQLVPITKSDGVTPLIPIPNGNHIISTSLTIDSVPITVQGYLLNRPNYSSIEGVLDNSVFNTQLTPMHNLLKRMSYWKSIFAQQPSTVIQFETGDKNVAFSTTLNGVTTKENNDVLVSQYPDQPLFIPYILNFTTETPFFFAETMENFSNGGLVKVSYQGLDLYCLPIGKMSTLDVTRDIQKWSLLVSAKTPFLTLLSLSTQGTIIKTMSNSIFRSDYNTLHFVKYNYQAPDAYDNQSEIYEDWFVNRNEPWVNHPEYLQKVQTTDTIVDQIIVNSISSTITLKMFDCATGYLVSTYAYSAVSPTPIPLPDVVLQTTIDFTNVSDGEYFFAIHVGTNPVAISERISVRDRWHGTILINSANTRNKTGAIFSNGWRSQIRVEGLVEKWRGGIEDIINEDEIGNFDVLHSVTTRKRTILFGSGTGIPDYLYLKICNAIVLDDLRIQGVGYIISKDAAVEPVDRIAGYPMYYYSVDFDLKDNAYGYTFDNLPGKSISNVVLVVDAGAFGMGGGGFAEITLENE